MKRYHLNVYVPLGAGYLDGVEETIQRVDIRNNFAGDAVGHRLGIYDEPPTSKLKRYSPDTDMSPNDTLGCAVSVPSSAVSRLVYPVFVSQNVCPGQFAPPR